MKHTAAILVTSLAVGAVLGAMGSRLVAAQQGSESRTMLVTEDLAGIEGYEVRVWRTDLGPGVVGQSTTTLGRNASTSSRAP